MTTDSLRVTLDALTDPARQQAGAAWLAEAAVGYVAAFEAEVIPALRAAGWKQVRIDVLTSYLELKRRLALLLVAAPGSPAAAQALAAFAEVVQAHHLACGTGLWPALAALALRLAAEPLPAADVGSGPLDLRRAGALIDEARLILTALPARPSR